MGDAAEGGVSKKAVKNALADATKASKKRPDPEGLRLIEQGESAFAAKDLDKALELFKLAEEKCKHSVVDAVAKEKKPKAVKPEVTDASAGKEADAAVAESEAAKKPRLYLSIPKDNNQAKPLREGVDPDHNYAANTESRLSTHLVATGGAFRTRFPPEPNGYLHIGHAKAMNFNFGQARIATDMGYGGATIMRFDDTNPTAEKQEFIDSILDNVAWLGHSPMKVTYSSDYFQQLYELAVQLIKDGGAFVCHQSAAEIKASRDVLRTFHGRGLPANQKGPLPKDAGSPFRNRTVDENLHHFKLMKQGRYAEGEAFLRVKGDLLSENSSMFVACLLTPPCTPRLPVSLADHQPLAWAGGTLPHTASCITSTRRRAMPGASTPLTTTRTASSTHSRTSRTRFALWSSRNGRPSTGHIITSCTNYASTSQRHGSTLA